MSRSVIRVCSRRYSAGGLYLTAVGLLGLFIGVLLRRTTGALAVLFGILLVMPEALGLLPGQLSEHLGEFLPANGGEADLPPAARWRVHARPLAGLRRRRRLGGSRGSSSIRARPKEGRLMSETMLATTASAGRPAGPPARLRARAALSAEWIKLRSLRSMLVTPALTAVFCIGWASLICLRYVKAWPHIRCREEGRVQSARHQLQRPGDRRPVLRRARRARRHQRVRQRPDPRDARGNTAARPHPRRQDGPAHPGRAALVGGDHLRRLPGRPGHPRRATSRT